jgi:hypothetical protein
VRRGLQLGELLSQSISCLFSTVVRRGLQLGELLPQSTSRLLSFSTVVKQCLQLGELLSQSTSAGKHKFPYHQEEIRFFQKIGFLGTIKE